MKTTQQIKPMSVFKLTKVKWLHFGCGDEIWNIDFCDNADIQKEAPLSFDFDKFPYPIKDNTYNYVYSKNVLEHLNDPEKVLLELWRVCKNLAIIELDVPYYNSKGAYSSLQHKRWFNDTAFITFVNDTSKIKKRQKFRLLGIKLKPTIIGKFIYPKWLRNKLSLFLHGIICQMKIELEVIK